MAARPPPMPAPTIANVRVFIDRPYAHPGRRGSLSILDQVRVIVCLGGWAWDGTCRAIAGLGERLTSKPRFGHGAEAQVGSWRLLGCYHPSQQNTFTGRLTAAMLDGVLERAKGLAGWTANRDAPDGRTVGL